MYSQAGIVRKLFENITAKRYHKTFSADKSSLLPDIYQQRKIAITRRLATAIYQTSVNSHSEKKNSFNRKVIQLTISRHCGGLTPEV